MPMKIAFIITGLNTGGAEMMLLKVLERLDARFSPHVISLCTPGEMGPRIQALGIPVESLGMQPGVPSPLAFFRSVRRLKTLKPDVVHTWMYHADLLGGVAARLAGVPAIGWAIRNSNIAQDKTKLSTRVVVGACAQVSRWVPDRILSCSEVARQVHVAYGYAADKMVVVPNGFDLARFQPDARARAAVRAELGVGDAPLVGLIGRFDPQKNHAGFFEAAGSLQSRLPAVHFVLAGQGIDEENRELMRLAEAAGVHQVTHLLGLRNDISRLMAALDVLASSSSWGEAFPNVLGEAMACGVPCAVTDVGDSGYIVSDTGRVVRSGDMPGLARAMEELLTLSPTARVALSKRTRARVAEHFEIGRVVKRYEAFYEELAEIGLRKHY